MKEYITPERVATSILIKRKKQKKCFIVEGNHDRLFFLKFKDSDVNVEIAFGWENVIEVLKILKKENFLDVIGIIDSDFKLMVPEKFEKLENLILTDYHDVNTLTLDKSFDVVIKTHESEEKINSFLEEKKKPLKEYIYSLARPLAMLKLLNKRENYNISFKGKKNDSPSLDFSKFINKDKFEYISNEKLIETIINYCNGKTKMPLPTKDILIDKLNELIKLESKNYTDVSLICGHDFGEIAVLGLKKRLGSKSIKGDDFLNECVLNYDSMDFKKTKLYQSIKDIETKTFQTYLKV
ncbi:DUF4435 domain-containing protein [Chryseobacterium luteum]|uniref:Uncharacterized protein n=1 Tax=Chryseobacterium luteum TaxID=421531 RepID=A0A085ZD06_9FLAO|nr:DUF4435 domain-containing protein [Chryseobacterium luteum]KFF02320.1 hypothetical protein IX38_13950 [Chryseobacterium luteum]